MTIEKVGKGLYCVDEHNNRRPVFSVSMEFDYSVPQENPQIVVVAGGRRLSVLNADVSKFVAFLGRPERRTCILVD